MRRTPRPEAGSAAQRPVVAVAFEINGSGEEQAFIGGERVVPMLGESPREAALRIIAGRCAKLATQGGGVDPIPVAARGVSGAVLHLLVHPDGHVDVVGEDPPKPDEFGVWPDAETPGGGRYAPAPAFTVPQQVPVGPTALDPSALTEGAEAVPPASTSRRPARRLPRPTASTDPAVPIPSSDSAGGDGLAGGIGTARTGGPVLLSRLRARVGTRSDLGHGLHTTMTVLLVVTIVVIAALAVLSSTGNKASPQHPLLTGEQAAFPEAAPVGFSGAARWAAGPLDPEAGAAVTDKDSVAFVTTDRQLVLADAVDGRARWSARLPQGRISGGLHRTHIERADVLAVRVGDRLLWWSFNDGEPGGIDLPPGAGLSYHGHSPLVGLDASTVAAVTAQGLQRTAVPAGAYPLAVRADGRITAASPKGWWHLQPGTPPGLPGTWERTEPVGAPTKVSGYGGSSIITVHPPDDTERPHLVVHTDRDGEVLVSFRAPYVPTGQDAWIPSPSGTWGILGRTLVDIENGRVADLGQWRTVHVGDDRAVGIIDGEAVVAGPAIERGVLATDAFPEAVTSAGAVVRRDSDQGQMIHLLPPTQER
ncbi:hypothetical protein [Gephyromycinifex aptenodytis]|uniref:hypothetical protein n=1 Tax=Gephyromycinifex aptenodytis TaxID=2716227 RepID=UPI0014488855|nr:hypothetical protein [Gephyromycinifex aptenodytis]